jgi:hypothetical protein
MNDLISDELLIFQKEFIKSHEYLNSRNWQDFFRW